MTNQEKVQILDYRQTFCGVILSGFLSCPIRTVKKKERVIAGFIVTLARSRLLTCTVLRCSLRSSSRNFE